jgi:CheY-like chemotaxis protein
MSYPRVIQPLIIEDSLDAQYMYKTIFDSLTGYNLAPPCYAYCYSDAVAHLESSTIFHLVVLDLRLPEHPGMPASDGIDLGLAVLERCVKRDKYPIPVLLVISGAIQRAQQQELAERVRTGFAHGQVLVKAPTMDAAIHDALIHIDFYCDLGLHIRDSGERLFPTISPREEDLLRRCVLHQKGCTGIDLEWWSAEYVNATGSHAGFKGWTKTLMGYFLLDGGDKASRPNFFKMAPATGAEVVIQAAQRMEHKLSHIKVRSTVVSDSRYLLVTEKVGSGHDRPIALADYLNFGSAEVWKALPRVVLDIVEQLRSLGAKTALMCPIRDLLWKWHDRDRIAGQWEAYGGRTRTGLTVNPLGLYDRLEQSTVVVRVEQQSFLHGDLNITNVALDRGDDGTRAYIFDAEGSTPDVNARDLAMLEVTSLLHQPSEGTSLVEACAGLYDPEFIMPENYTDIALSDRTRNTMRLIDLIRKQAYDLIEPRIYAFLVFDISLLQLGGLAFTVSRNKISNPADAALLVALAGQWLEKYDLT